MLFYMAYTIDCRPTSIIMKMKTTLISMTHEFKCHVLSNFSVVDMYFWSKNKHNIILCQKLPLTLLSKCWATRQGLLKGAIWSWGCTMHCIVTHVGAQKGYRLKMSHTLYT